MTASKVCAQVQALQKEKPDSRILAVDGESVQYVSAQNPGQMVNVCPYASNFVVTSRYTWYDFIPKNLIEQFSIYSNLYFLFIGILQTIPAITTTGGYPSIWNTLALVVFVSAVRAASEDAAKHRTDSQRNSQEYTVITNEGEKQVSSGNLKPGQFLKIMKNQMIPADLIFLQSSNVKGHCFIDKANLNGETKLELYTDLPETHTTFNNNNAKAFKAAIAIEQPTKDFDSFSGKMRLQTGDEVQSITLNSPLILRETTLRNTDFIYGIIAYTGSDTRLLTSNKGKKEVVKVSFIFKVVNRVLVGMFLFQVLLCTIAGIYAGFHVDDVYVYIKPAYSTPMIGFLAFWSWFILLNQMVPITLVVTAEMVKFGMNFFIQNDITMYSGRLNKRAKCNSSTIHEELGVVDYIFSDKTGTLTQNRMEFRYVDLPCGNFGSSETEISKSVKAKALETAMRREQGSDYVPPTHPTWTSLMYPLLPVDDLPEDPDCCRGPNGCCKCSTSCWNSPKVDYRKYDKAGGEQAITEFTKQEREDLLRALWGNDSTPETKAELHRFMRNIALSNTCKPYEDDGIIKYQAESAEEKAMVDWGVKMGFRKIKTNPTILEIQQYDVDLNKTEMITEIYDHVGTFGFTSPRARVTVIYIREDDQTCHILSKGADTAMLELLHSHDRKQVDGVNEDQLFMNLKEMANNGLRTLVMAYAEKPIEWWTEEREAMYDMLTNREISTDEEQAAKDIQELYAFFNECEKDSLLKYLGCMGMEDQLQYLVSDSIRDYLKADIKVWMITGDKLETAKNIGLACSLIDSDMVPHVDETMSANEIVTNVTNARLIEITGQWTGFSKDEEKLASLFTIFDTAGDGQLSTEELKRALKVLKFSVNSESFETLFMTIDKDKNGQISPDEFIELMKSAMITSEEAVNEDLDIGITRWKEIQEATEKGQENQPISLLLSKEAFEVMYPSEEKEEDAEKLEMLRNKFFLLASVAKSVVFARARPAMKKKMVTEVQARIPHAITLAIGDGANDTDMIKAAHVGVGIAGIEGTAATQAADYAIGEFRMLHTLLFVHGAWCYRRIGIMVCFIFYKAGLLAFSCYYFGFVSAFSGTQFYFDGLNNIYNVCYTALPIMAVAWMDMPLPRAESENTPVAYREQKGKEFNIRLFGSWILRAIIHSALAYYLVYFATREQIDADYGSTSSLSVFSSVIFYVIAFVPNFIIYFEMHTINGIHHLAVWITAIGSVLLFSWIISIVSNYPFYNAITVMYVTPVCWLMILLGTGTCIALELLFRGLKSVLRPNFYQVMRETELLKKQKKLKESKNTGSEDKAVSESSISLLCTFETEQKWVNRKGDNVRKRRNREAKKMLTGLPSSSRDTNAEEYAEEESRKALVRALLHFSNLTGAGFQSSANARFAAVDSCAARADRLFRYKSRDLEETGQRKEEEEKTKEEEEKTPV